MERLTGITPLPRTPKPEPRPTRLRGLAVVYGLGPEFAGGRRRERRELWPGAPPPGFVTPNTSGPEWAVYAAFAALTGDPRDPRTPPYFGSRGARVWSYQKMIDPQRTRFAILDFVYYTPGPRIGIRLVSKYFHIAQPAAVKAYDRLQRLKLEAEGFSVVDIYEEDFFFGFDDPRTGPAVMATVKEAVGLRERLDPIAAARSFVRR